MDKSDKKNDSSNNNNNNLEIVKAVLGEAEEIANLLNSSYRGEASCAGWTTEAHILSGKRTDKLDIENCISEPGSLSIICKIEGVIVGSIYVQLKDHSAYIGMFAVNPQLQGKGIGKVLLQSAEEWALKEWPQITQYSMSIIPSREELAQFYERRGYSRCDEFIPFPKSELWSPLVDHELTLQTMVKPIPN